MASKFLRSTRISGGVVLAAVTTIATIWLSRTKQLNLYISPRYDWFAVVMAGLSLVGIIAATLRKRSADHEHIAVSKKRSAPSLLLGLLAALLAVCLLCFQPKALTSSIALQRGINAGGLTLTSTITAAGFGATNYSQFDIRDWASVLSQTSQTSFYSSKTANQLTGFVAPAPGNPGNVFYVSRFYITCCAMDAQPYGVPVYVADWKKTYPVNSWVTVSGGFVANPDQGSANPIVLKPMKISSVPEPQDPYER